MTKTVLNTFTFDPPSQDADIQDVCTWLIRVMNKSDKSVVFVASVMTFFLQKGGISEKQFTSLQKVYDRVLDQYNRGGLVVQGCLIAEEDGTPTNIVKFGAKNATGRK